MKRIAGIICGLIATGALVAFFATHLHHQRVVTTVSPASPTPSPAPPAAPDPLTISAIKIRQYQSHPIAQTQNLGDRGAYHESVVSFISDGLTEYALQATPDTPAPSGGYPVIILLHGYIPPSQYQTNGSYYSDFIAAWSRAGFVVIRPD